jgi:hypothetical protein
VHAHSPLLLKVVFAWTNVAFSFGTFNISCALTVSLHLCFPTALGVTFRSMMLMHTLQIEVVVGLQYFPEAVDRIVEGDTLASSVLDKSSGQCDVERENGLFVLFH